MSQPVRCELDVCRPTHDGALADFNSPSYCTALLVLLLLLLLLVIEAEVAKALLLLLLLLLLVIGSDARGACVGEVLLGFARAETVDLASVADGDDDSVNGVG